MDAGKQGFRKVWMQERRDTRYEGYQHGSETASIKKDDNFNLKCRKIFVIVLKGSSPFALPLGSTLHFPVHFPVHSCMCHLIYFLIGNRCRSRTVLMLDVMYTTDPHHPS